LNQTGNSVKIGGVRSVGHPFFMKALFFFILFVTTAWGQTPVKPLRISPTTGRSKQFNASTDYANTKGYCFENSCAARLEKSGTQLGYIDEGDPFVSFDDIALQANAARWSLTLTNNGTYSNNEFIGYTELIPGDDSPIIVGIASQLTDFTFTNNRTNADYTLVFRKNSTTATPFFSVSKVNTQFFTETLGTPETFAAGDQIYIQYQDNGQNARDGVLVLFWKANL
jgi:hypothetical protein